MLQYVNELFKKQKQFTSPKLTLALRYKLAAVFLDIGNSNGVSWRKAIDFQFTEKFWYDDGASVDLIFIVTWADTETILERYRHFTKKVRHELRRPGPETLLIKRTYCKKTIMMAFF